MTIQLTFENEDFGDFQEPEAAGESVFVEERIWEILKSQLAIQFTIQNKCNADFREHLPSSC